MATIRYLFRRKDIYYFRFVVPSELRETLKVREIIKSLKTPDKQVALPLALKMASDVISTLQNLKTGKISVINSSELITLSLHNNDAVSSSNIFPALKQSQAPLLSTVVDDFLSRYKQENKATLTKLNSTLPILVELIGNKPINQILQVDINVYFGNCQCSCRLDGYNLG